MAASKVREMEDQCMEIAGCVAEGIIAGIVEKAKAKVVKVQPRAKEAAKAKARARVDAKEARVRKDVVQKAKVKVDELMQLKQVMMRQNGVEMTSSMRNTKMRSMRMI